MNDTLHDELLIRRMVERWAVWRDAGDWARIGYQAKLDMPMLKGPVVHELYQRGARWLAGAALER